jgi:signal recognition particle subunit SRP54
MQRQMGDMMKKMGKGGMLKQAMKGMFGKGGGLPAGMDPSQMDPKALEAAAKQMGASGGLGGGLGSGLPGLGGGMALPPGLSGFGKKK